MDYCHLFWMQSTFWMKQSKLTDRTVPHDPGWEEYIYICDKKPREEGENEGEIVSPEEYEEKFIRIIKLREIESKPLSELADDR